MTNYSFEFSDISTTLSGLNAGDTITFDENFNFENFSFLEDGDDLLIYADNGATIRLTDQLLSTALVYDLIFSSGGNIPLNTGNNIIGTSNNQTLTGTFSDDTIFGGTGNNNISGGTGNDIIYGGGGNDTINGNFGGDTIYGGDGDDTLYSDIITGPIPFNTNYTDALYGGAGNDLLHHESGQNAILNGGSGDDTYKIIHNNVHVIHAVIEDESGDNDYLTLNNDDGVSFERVGNDLVIKDGMPLSQNITTLVNHFSIGQHIEQLEFQEDFITHDLVEKLTSGNDVYNASTSSIGLDDNIINGLDGNDTIRGYAGNDLIYGDEGNDIIQGGDGNDILLGGNGFDRVYGDDGDDIIYGSAGNDYLFGGAGNDLFLFNDINDYLGSDRNVIKGGFDSGDIIDISDLLDYDGTGPLSDYVVLTDNGTNTIISVDTDGGVNNFTQVVIIQNISGLWTDADDMVAQGNLVALIL